MIIRRDKKNKKSKNRKKTDLACIFRKVFFAILLICFWSIAIWTIFFSEVMQIDQITVTSNAGILNADEIRQEIESQLEGKYLWSFPKKNLLFIRKNHLKRALYERHKLIREVSIESEFPNDLNVSIEEREAHIGWCFSEKCFLVDELGEAFLEIEKDHIDSVKVIDSSNKNVNLGERTVDPEFIFFVEKIPSVIQDELHIDIYDELVTPSSMSNEVRVKTKEGWGIYLSTSRKIETQIEILKKITRETVGQENISDLEYIDLRIKGKAIYKLRGEDDEKDENGEDSDSENYNEVNDD